MICDYCDRKATTVVQRPATGSLYGPQRWVCEAYVQKACDGALTVWSS